MQLPFYYKEKEESHLVLFVMAEQANLPGLSSHYPFMLSTSVPSKLCARRQVFKPRAHTGTVLFFIVRDRKLRNLGYKDWELDQ